MSIGALIFMTRSSIKKLVLIGVLSALSVILVVLIRFPIFPAVAFLEYDPADVPIFLITALYGPAAGLGMTAVVSIIQGLTVSAASGWIGILMHFLATGSYVAMMSLAMRIGLDNKKGVAVTHGNMRVLVSMAAGVVTWTLTMALWNLLFTPYFMHVTLDDLLPLYPFIIAFNIIKAVINSVVAYALFVSLKKTAYKFIAL